jgi:hypothetical protein
MDSMALCSLAGRFLVQSRTEMGWDIAFTFARLQARKKRAQQESYHSNVG